MDNRSYKITIVDDEIWIRENLKRTISSFNMPVYSLDFAENGEEALARMEKNCPDLLITDINMPFMNGIELIKKVRAAYPNVVVCVLSGYSDFEYVKESLLEGAFDYILKPIGQTNLENVLTKAFRLIDNKRKESFQIKERNEKLQMASSIIFDKELSELIDGDEIKNVQSINNTRLTEIELNFAKFNLLLIKTDSINNIKKRLGLNGSNNVIMKIKNIIADPDEDDFSFVFNNIFVPNEFIAVVFDKDSKYIERKCDRVIAQLNSYTGSYVSVAVSSNHFSFEHMRQAYNEALIAMMTRKFKRGNYKIDAAGVEKIPLAQSLTSEQENQIIYAVQNNNKKMLRSIIIDQIRLQDFDKKEVMFFEAKQTIDKIAWLIVNYSGSNKTPTDVLEIETLLEMLNLSIEKYELNEAVSIMEQIIDVALNDSDCYCSNENIRKIVKSVKKYINDNYFEDLSLTSLAKQFLVDRSYLSKAFKHETGENLMPYIAKKRVEKAKELIRDGSANLTDISSLVGYDDYAYFNRVFRKFTGQSPREYKTAVIQRQNTGNNKPILYN